jgi:type III pantothenate kinase
MTMILLIDIGNTQIEIGINRSDKLVNSWRISSDIKRTEDEYMILLHFFLKQLGIDPKDITGIVLASVVPNQTAIFEKLCQKYFNSPPLLVDHTIKLGINILYSDPSMVGADRLCNTVAAYRKYHQSVIVVDFGTATTFDVVNGKGDYLGGVISPGTETTAWALYQRAAKLPKISLQFPDNFIGKNTEQSMQIGIMHGTIKLVDGILTDIITELGEKPKIISTGGLGRLIQPKTEMIKAYFPHLVLEGLYEIYKMNEPANSN